MQQAANEQRTLSVAVYPDLRRWIDGFLIAKRAGNKARRTLEFYSYRLKEFADFCNLRNAQIIEVIDAGLIREFLLHLEERGHNPGGRHSYFRTIRVFLRWYENEAAPDGWRNPMRRVDAPKVPEQILEPVPLEDVARMVATADSLRDRAILLTLLDTGARASELLAFDIADLDLVSGHLAVRHGKGDKPRSVFLGRRSRKIVRAYLRARGDLRGPLFVTHSGNRLRYTGLKSMIRRRAIAAGVPVPAVHAFRRAFAIQMLRAGADLLTLQRLLGHSDMSQLYLYAKQVRSDLQAAHALNSPVDTAGW